MKQYSFGCVTDDWLTSNDDTLRCDSLMIFGTPYRALLYSWMPTEFTNCSQDSDNYILWSEYILLIYSKYQWEFFRLGYFALWYQSVLVLLRCVTAIASGHYNDVIMSAIASQITSLTIIYLSVYSGADQRKHQSSASLTLVRGIHRWAVNSPHKGPVTRKIFPLDDVIMWDPDGQF